MSQQAIVESTTLEREVSISDNFRIHTIGVVVSGGVVRVDAQVPGGNYEPVMDTATGQPLELIGTESITLSEIAMQKLKFKPDGATYSAIVTSQAYD